MTLDRFDPGRDQPGSSGRVPCTVLPGDVVVPCVFVTLGDASEAVVQSESELHHCFKVSCCSDIRYLITCPSGLVASLQSSVAVATSHH